LEKVMPADEPTQAAPFVSPNYAARLVVVIEQANPDNDRVVGLLVSAFHLLRDFVYSWWLLRLGGAIFRKTHTLHKILDHLHKGF
jgi:hypothetical protein